MYLAVSPAIAFPLAIDPYGRPRGLGQLPVAAIISGGMSLVTSAIQLIMQSGCGVTCVETSAWANQAENLLKQNIAAYFSLPAPRSIADRQAALANFDQIWAGLVQRCGQSGTGTAGVRCISDREAGACTWQQTATSALLGYPGEPQSGCWNWFSGYRDPIANDPQVTANVGTETGDTSDPVNAALSTVYSDAASIATSAGLPQGSGGLLLLGLAAAVVLVVVIS